MKEGDRPSTDLKALDIALTRFANIEILLCHLFHDTCLNLYCRKIFQRNEVDKELSERYDDR